MARLYNLKISCVPNLKNCYLCPLFMMKKKINLKEKIRQFRQWREQPHQVAPMSEEEHTCATCGTHFVGNNCPRCGQAARIGRFSFKTGILNFLDVWGLGNRNMFLTIRDLILRPGYMIRDYLKGMQMAYFPPFKMFFLLAALSLLVAHGFNVKGKTFAKDGQDEDTEVIVSGEEAGSSTATTDMTDAGSGAKSSDYVGERAETKHSVEFSVGDNPSDYVGERTKEILHGVMDRMERFQNRFPNILSLMLLLLVSSSLYLFFRHCPNIPDLRYSELFVALVYIANMTSIYAVFFLFFCQTTLSQDAFMLALIPLKQLSGYNWWQTVWRVVTAFVLMFVVLIILVVAVVFATYLFVKWFG